MTKYRNFKKILNFVHETGLVRFGHKLLKKSLTVINYHRVANLEDFQDSFQPNISASPLGFDEQIQYLMKWYQIISIDNLNDYLINKKPLPPHPVLITFDDGYLDNYTNAFPVLYKNKLPAIIFLASGYISSNLPFYWDLASYCFKHSKKDYILFPNNQERKWSSENEKKKVLQEWIEALKLLSETEKLKWIDQLANIMGVSVSENQYQNMMLTWEHVREMHSMKIDFGAHTITHPILTRIPIEQARKEIIGSKQKIEEELKHPVTSFAYPNGTRHDFNKEVIKATKEAGITTAFTLLNGPTLLSEVIKSPLAIRRIFISHRHTISHFSSLLSPINRFR